jgi:hypothetical protein
MLYMVLGARMGSVNFCGWRMLQRSLSCRLRHTVVDSSCIRLCSYLRVLRDSMCCQVLWVRLLSVATNIEILSRIDRYAGCAAWAPPCVLVPDANLASQGILSLFVVVAAKLRDTCASLITVCCRCAVVVLWAALVAP